MAGEGLSVVADHGPVQRRLARMAGALGGDGRLRFFKAAAVQVQAETERNFETESMQGRLWRPHALATIENRLGRGGRFSQLGAPGAKGFKLLQRTGQLRQSITARVTPDQAVVGSNLPQARIQNRGGWAGPGRKVFIPARPFMAVTPETREELKELLRKVVFTSAR